MQSTRLRPVLALFAAACALIPTASAQELELRLGKRDPRLAVSFDWGGARDCAPTPRFQPPRVWVPGCYQSRWERVWVPGCVRREWTPAVYQWRVTTCGRRERVLIRAGCWRDVVEPGRFESRQVQVWVPGHWRSQPC
jgi:hypothetical protein